MEVSLLSYFVYCRHFLTPWLKEAPKMALEMAHPFRLISAAHNLAFPAGKFVYLVVMAV